MYFLLHFELCTQQIIIIIFFYLESFCKYSIKHVIKY